MLCRRRLRAPSDHVETCAAPRASTRGSGARSSTSVASSSGVRPSASIGTYEPATNGHAVDWGDVRAVVAGLPERQRLVLFLRHYADLDYDRIGAVLGIERGTVAATLHAAHRKIRQAITEVPR